LGDDFLAPMSEHEKDKRFKIQPHPAEPPQLGAGLNNKPEFSALNPRGGPYIPSQDILRSLDPPSSRKEGKRADELNKKES